VLVGLDPLGRYDLRASVADRGQRRLGERCGADEPLRADQGLDDGVGSLRARQRHRVRLRAALEPQLREARLDRLARHEAIQPLELAALGVEGAVEVEDVDLGQAVALAGGEVVEVGPA
jgi:hypothetical protein